MVKTYGPNFDLISKQIPVKSILMFFKKKSMKYLFFLSKENMDLWKKSVEIIWQQICFLRDFLFKYHKLFFSTLFQCDFGKMTWSWKKKKKWFRGGWKKQLNTVKLYSREGKWKGLSIFNLTKSKKEWFTQNFFTS